MTFEQIRDLAATDWAQANKEAQAARPHVRLTAGSPATLIGVDDCGSAIVERAGWTAYWTAFEHLEAADKTPIPDNLRAALQAIIDRKEQP